MGDVMELARARRSELEGRIADHEKEIANMREEMEALADFVEYGEALLSGNPPSPAAAAPAEAEANEGKDITEIDFDEDFDPFDDADDEGASVQQLHADRPISRPA